MLIATLLCCLLHFFFMLLAKNHFFISSSSGSCWCALSVVAATNHCSLHPSSIQPPLCYLSPLTYAFRLVLLFSFYLVSPFPSSFSQRSWVLSSECTQTISIFPPSRCLLLCLHVVFLADIHFFDLF